MIDDKQLCLEQEIAPDYHSFVSSIGRLPLSFSPDICVRVTAEIMPQIEGVQRIFTSGESWHLFKGNGFLYITLQPESFQEAFWTAKFDPLVTDVDFIFNNDIIEKFFFNQKKSLANLIHYPLDQILITYHMALHNKGLLVHSAGIEMEGKGYVFPGSSGAGKTTLIRQLVGLDNCVPLSDDRMIVRKIDNLFHAYGTPWPSEAGVAVNKGVPLSGLFFIHHADENRVETLTQKIAVERLMPVSSIPWYDREAVINLLDFCDDLTCSVPAYDLYFKPTTDIADFLRTFHFPESND